MNWLNVQLQKAPLRQTESQFYFKIQLAPSLAMQLGSLTHNLIRTRRGTLY